MIAVEVNCHRVKANGGTTLPRKLKTCCSGREKHSPALNTADTMSLLCLTYGEIPHPIVKTQRLQLGLGTAELPDLRRPPWCKRAITR